MADLSIEQLIEDIQTKDRRFRVAQSVFIVVVILGLAGLGLFQYEQNQQLRHDNTALESSIKGSIGKQTAYIKCLAQFFTHTDRAHLQLKDLDKCDLVQTGQAVTFTPTLPLAAPAARAPLAVAKQPAAPPAITPTPSNAGNAGNQNQSPPPKKSFLQRANDGIDNLVSKATSLL